MYDKNRDFIEVGIVQEITDKYINIYWTDLDYVNDQSCSWVEKHCQKFKTVQFDIDINELLT